MSQIILISVSCFLLQKVLYRSDKKIIMLMHLDVGSIFIDAHSLQITI